MPFLPLFFLLLYSTLRPSVTPFLIYLFSFLLSFIPNVTSCSLSSVIYLFSLFLSLFFSNSISLTFPFFSYTSSHFHLTLISSVNLICIVPKDISLRFHLPFLSFFSLFFPTVTSLCLPFSYLLFLAFLLTLISNECPQRYFITLEKFLTNNVMK